jgi:hypothetical protein
MIVISYYFIITYNTTMSSASKMQATRKTKISHTRAHVKRETIAQQMQEDTDTTMTRVKHDTINQQIQVARKAKWACARVKREAKGQIAQQAYTEHMRVVRIKHTNSAERVFQFVHNVFAGNKHSIIESVLRVEVDEYLQRFGPICYWRDASYGSNMRMYYLEMKSV